MVISLCLLESEKLQMVFLKDEDDPLKADAVIVDEMSMVDILLLHSLMKAVAPGKRLVLVGDPDQLPPVGAGSFLKSQLFRDMVQQQAGIELYMPELPPAYGACVEALRMSDIALEENFYKNFADSYRRVLCSARK